MPASAPNTVFPLEPPLRPSNGQIRRALGHLGWPGPRPDGTPLVVGLANRERLSGRYDDALGAFRAQQALFFQGTTDPGRRPVLGQGRIPTHPDGVARLRPGYHRGYFSFGFHHHQANHPCLRQAAPAPFERFDCTRGVWVAYPPDNRNMHLHRYGWDWEPPGLNAVPAEVGDASHGCGVIPDRYEHWALMEFVGWDARRTEDRIDYALIDWIDYLRRFGHLL